MPLIVQKYGGTSVGNPDRIRKVAERLLETQRTGNRVVGVISAMSGVTDNLLKLAREVSPRPDERELDILLATGECGAVALVAMAVNALGGRAISLTGAQAGILTDRTHTKARSQTLVRSKFTNCYPTITSWLSPASRDKPSKAKRPRWAAVAPI